MTAFLFIPSSAGGPIERRLDLANIASLFSETEEHVPRPDPGRNTRIALLIVLLLGVVGDMILVTRPAALTNQIDTIRPVSGHVTTL